MALANNPHLPQVEFTLDLRGNEIGDEGATALAYGIANNHNLPHGFTLNLVNNQIGHEGIIALAEALENLGNVLLSGQPPQRSEEGG